MREGTKGEIGPRVKQLRKYLGMSGDKFGDRIGITKVTISTMENGKTETTEQTIKLIVSQFGVNEYWLRYGEGEMLKDQDSYRTTLIERYQAEGDPYKLMVIDAFLNYDEKQWGAFRDFACSLATDSSAVSGILKNKEAKILSYTEFEDNDCDPDMDFDYLVLSKKEVSEYTEYMADVYRQGFIEVKKNLRVMVE